MESITLKPQAPVRADRGKDPLCSRGGLNAEMLPRNASPFSSRRKSRTTLL